MKQTFDAWAIANPLTVTIRGEAFGPLYDYVKAAWDAAQDDQVNAAIDKVLNISTAYLPEEVGKWLIGFAGFPTMYDHPDGLGTIVVIPPYLQNDAEGDPEAEAALRADWGDEFVNILKWAKNAAGCWAVNFDGDGDDSYDQFPMFEW